MFKLFKKNKKEDKREMEVKSYTGNGDILYTPIWENNCINLVHDACVICVDGHKERTYEERAKFIAGAVKKGHESILEHSNFIVKLEMDRERGCEWYADMAQCFKYLNVKTKIEEDKFILLIGGSVRGFKHIIRTIEFYSNPIYQTILEYIKNTMPSCFFSDMIDQNIFFSYDFTDMFISDDDNVEKGDPYEVYELYHFRKLHDYRKDIQWDEESYGQPLVADEIETIYKRLKGEFSYYDLMDFCTMSIAFVNVSRACSHQLVRHRSAITQLSQRYVNMKNAKNIYPNALDAEQVCINPCTEGDKEYAPVSECVDMIYNYYNQLVENGVKREDARYIIPNSCATTLYMTFTFRNLLKSYDLRVSPHAQKEIRELFENMFKEYDVPSYIVHESTIQDPVDYSKPRYAFEEIYHNNGGYDLNIDFDELDKREKDE